MGMLYTSLPYSDPVRQQYQTIIDNSRRSLAKKKVSEWKFETEPLAAQVKDGKIVDTWSDRNNSRSANYSSITERRKEFFRLR